MDSRLFFVLGDLFCNIFVGTLVGWLCWLLIPLGWSMLIAMLLAMAIGMLVAFFIFPVLSYFWGAMEVMVPTMLSGMLSGMAVGMWCAMVPVARGEALFVGGVCGLVAIVSVWVLNNSLRGKHTGITGG